MSSWFGKVKASLGNLPDCITFFENELIAARRELKVDGSLEKAAREMPGLVEFRFIQLQELEAILEHLNLEARKLRGAKFRHFTEHYNKTLTSRDAEKYVDGEQDVFDMDCIINEFALVRNKFLGLVKGLDIRQWQVSGIIKLRVAGMEDAELR